MSNVHYPASDLVSMLNRHFFFSPMVNMRDVTRISCMLKSVRNMGSGELAALLKKEILTGRMSSGARIKCLPSSNTSTDSTPKISKKEKKLLISSCKMKWTGYIKSKR